MRTLSLVAFVAAALLLCANAGAQSGPSTAIVKPQPSPDTWSFTTYIDGYIAPHSSFLASPIFTADHDQLHLEARYGYEDRYLGSLWAGYNFTAGTSLKLALTPMLNRPRITRERGPPLLRQERLQPLRDAPPIDATPPCLLEIIAMHVKKVPNCSAILYPITRADKKRNGFSEFD